ncbi:hypothetical protein GCM10017044_12290 [Kordiimonas sediminis]|uniref:Uncharacterized protein n=1 Tax=Kordiimonas sediminis TaxID=1735581 RepID=A0A919AS20_9PROT|nr:hypothetical protein [Kordiimonas sediminis]GHF19276.1 hypothetical protein GCM10017044_12290 [Kordiimonas sediminis]
MFFCACLMVVGASKLEAAQYRFEGLTPADYNLTKRQYMTYFIDRDKNEMKWISLWE